MEKKDSWQKRWQDGVTPWDMGAPHPLGKRLLESAQREGRLPSGSRILVPGCGGGHEAGATVPTPVETDDGPSDKE